MLIIKFSMKSGPEWRRQSRRFTCDILFRSVPPGTRVPPRLCPRHQAGFTLLEMILVLAIVALVASVVAPAITTGIKSAKLQTSCRKASALMRQARNRAVAFKQTMVVDIDRKDQRLTIYPFTGLRKDQEREFRVGEDRVNEAGAVTEPGEDRKGELPAHKVISYLLPQGISIGEMKIGGEELSDEVTRFVFFFYPDGRSTGGEILFRDDRGRSLRILVDRITGSAEIREPLEENER